MSVGHLYFFFGELSVQFLCPFFNWIICFLFVEACEPFIYFGRQALSDLSFTNIFSHTVGFLFVLLMVFRCTEAFQLNVVPLAHFFILFPLPEEICPGKNCSYPPPIFFNWVTSFLGIEACKFFIYFGC